MVLMNQQEAMMWGCNWGNPFGHGPWFWGHGLFGFLLGIVLIIAVISLVLFFIKLLTGKDIADRDRNDSLMILKKKYANGELSEQEYIRMRDILTT